MRLTVHIFSGSWDIPSESPFCLKLLTWLKIAEIPFEASRLTGPPKSKSGKAPYLEREDGTILEDSSAIIEALTKERSIELDAHRTPLERARMLTVQRMVETHLYFAVLLHRWRDHWPEVRTAYFKGMMPAPLLWVAGPMIRRGTLKQAAGQGIGRMPWPKALAEAEDDLRALSTILGEQDFFMGTVGVADAIVYGVLENVRREPFDGPIKDALLQHDNLVAWLDRMTARYWA